MKAQDKNKIDTLFRHEFNSFEVPVTNPRMSQVNQAVSKGTFLKFSLAKFNIYYAIILGTSAAAAASVGGVKAYTVYRQYVEEKRQEEARIVRNNGAVAASFADSLASLESIEKVDTASVIAVEVQSPVQQPKPVPAEVTKKAEALISAKPQAIVDESTASTNIQLTADDKTDTKAAEIAMVEAKSDASPAVAAADSSVKVTRPRRVVYVKPQQVVVEDTVIQVVKKKRKK